MDFLGRAGADTLTVTSAAVTFAAGAGDDTVLVQHGHGEQIRLTFTSAEVGNGSANDPYRISWELLTSSSAFIDPAQTATTPPPWVRLLDGTYIELSGYYSTALRVPIATNLLLTLNRWDGCCIGLPPTPFDAIDVTMRTPLPLEGAHLIRFGTFRGRLSVSVFEIGGFLLGLYRLEDTTFETK